MRVRCFIHLIHMMTRVKKISVEKARQKFVNSKTYKCLYNFDTGLWKEGSDYLREFYNKVK